jgi:hypothetical protein
VSSDERERAQAMADKLNAPNLRIGMADLLKTWSLSRTIAGAHRVRALRSASETDGDVQGLYRKMSAQAW